MSKVKAGDHVEHDGVICIVVESYASRAIIQPILGGFREDVDVFDVTGPIPVGFKAMSSAPKVHMAKIKLYASDYGVVVGWWDAEIENFWSKRQHPSLPPIPPLGDWCCNEAGKQDSDKRMVCGMTPKAWKEVTE